MNLGISPFPFFLLIISSLIASTTSAQDVPTVSAGGEEVLQRWPTEMVLRIDLIGRAGTLEEALQTLEKRKEAAELLLKSLGAKEDTVQYGDPTTSNAASQGQEQMQAMIRQRIQRSGGSIPEGLKMPESTTVTLPLTARWPLDATDPTKLLQQVSELRKQIEEADIAGMKTDETSLAEQEMLEEAEAFGFDPYSNEQQAKPGTPVFTFAAQITQEEQSQAMKAAFQSAKASAKQLAAAASLELGELLSLTSASNSGVSAEAMYGYGYNRRMAMLLENNDPLSAESQQLGKLSFQYHVQVRFRLVATNSN